MPSNVNSILNMACQSQPWHMWQFQGFCAWTDHIFEGGHWLFAAPLSTIAFHALDFVNQFEYFATFWWHIGQISTTWVSRLQLHRLHYIHIRRRLGTHTGAQNVTLFKLHVSYTSHMDQNYIKKKIIINLQYEHSVSGNIHITIPLSKIFHWNFNSFTRFELNVGI